ncbi:unnamed protein product, partial [Rhizoctonia solani]
MHIKYFEDTQRWGNLGTQLAKRGCELLEYLYELYKLETVPGQPELSLVAGQKSSVNSSGWIDGLLDLTDEANNLMFPNEIRSYLDGKYRYKGGDILAWWKENQSHLPVLSGIARDILAIPATSVLVERLFSRCKLVMSDYQNTSVDTKWDPDVASRIQFSTLPFPLPTYLTLETYKMMRATQTQSKPKPKSKPRLKSQLEVNKLSSLFAESKESLGPSVELKNPNIWAGALAALEDAAKQDRKADGDEITREKVKKEWRRGYAVLRFAGQGEASGIIEMDQDPNLRTNPRSLREDHVINLFGVFTTDGVNDRASPIRIREPSNGLDPELLKQMAAADPADPNSPIPTLYLKREHAQRENQLETEIFTRQDGVQLLSNQEVQQRKDELAKLRGARELATLLDGNHRLNSMRLVGQLLQEKALHIVQSERNQVADFDPKEEYAKLTELVKKATYIVEVYAYDTPPHVLAWLSENEKERPHLAPVAGETIWRLVDNQERVADQIIQQKQA